MSFKKRHQISIFVWKEPKWQYVQCDTGGCNADCSTDLSAQSPPGGLCQEDSANDSNMPLIGMNGAIFNTTAPTKADDEAHISGKIIMRGKIIIPSTAWPFLLRTSLAIFLPTSWWLNVLLLTFPLYAFLLCYMLSWQIITPGLQSAFVLLVWTSLYTVASIWLSQQCKCSSKLGKRLDIWTRDMSFWRTEMRDICSSACIFIIILIN